MNEDALRYIDGEMSDKERIEFEAALKNDPLLKEDYDVLVAAKKVSGHMMDAEILGYLEKMKASKPAETPRKNKTWWVILLMIGICISAIVYYLDQTGETSENIIANIPYASNYEDPIWPLERNAGDSLQLAISLHLSGRTDEGLAILLSKPENMTYLYWAAEVMVHDHKCSDAKEILAKLSGENIEKSRVELMKSVCKY